MTHSTANAGAFLVLRDNVPEGSTITGNNVLVIDADGGVQAVSGTTILMELNSSGIYHGTTQIVSTLGLVNFAGSVQQTTNVTTVADKTLTQAESGSLIIIDKNTDTSVAAILPVNPTPGTWYDFFLNGQADLGDFTIKTTGDSSAKISLAGRTSAVSTVDNITPMSTVPCHIKMTAVSSILWSAQPFMGWSSANTTDISANDHTIGAWGLGATA
jgi:hypothetical protein